MIQYVCTNTSAAGPVLWLRRCGMFIYDRQLDAYKTKPEPAEIADIVSKARRLKDVKGRKP